jgi:hypothetical protein
MSMGFKKTTRNLDFADLAMATCLEHNRSIKLMEHLSKRGLILRQENPPKKRSENMEVECCQKSGISSTIRNHALIKLA